MVWRLVSGLVLLLTVARVTEAQVGKCTTIGKCACVYDDGLIVNLTSLSKTSGDPYFYNASDSRGDLYSWNPCTPFTFTANGSECINVAVCMIRKGIPKELFYSLGTEDSAQFAVDENGTLSLTYEAQNDGFLRRAVITLQCAESSHFDFFVPEGEQDENNSTIDYKMVLASKWACALAPNINPNTLPVTDDKLSGGSIFVIVLVSLIGAYLVFGVMYQLVVKKETGSKLCPNHEFWFGLPGLIKDGCRCSSKEGGDQGKKYDSI